MNWEELNWEAISAIGEAVGAAGVIFSLLYLALQVRADARARRTAAIQQELGVQADIQRSIGLDADSADIYYRGLRDPAALSDVERVRFSLIVSSVFKTLEATFYYFKDGQLDPDVWQGKDATTQDMFAYPGYRAVWRTRSHHHSREFQASSKPSLRITESLACTNCPPASGTVHQPLPPPPHPPREPPAIPEDEPGAVAVNTLSKRLFLSLSTSSAMVRGSIFSNCSGVSSGGVSMSSRCCSAVPVHGGRDNPSA